MFFLVLRIPLLPELEPVGGGLASREGELEGGVIEGRPGSARKDQTDGTDGRTDALCARCEACANRVGPLWLLFGPLVDRLVG